MYSIIADTPDFIIVNKYAGVDVHTHDQQPGLVVQLQQDFDHEYYLVHRLDKVTSGLMVCAKNKAAASELSQLFQDRVIDKYYLAISDKKPRKKQGLIKGDMQKARRGSWKLSPSQDNPAITQFFSYALENKRRLFLLKPKTGKTHQLRVAMKSLGAPIIGDQRYGHTEALDNMIYLHAYTLCFQYQSQDYCYQSLPEHWGTVMRSKDDGAYASALNCPWELPWPTVK